MILSHGEEVELLAVLLHDRYQLRLPPCFGIEDLALAVDDELLEIVGYLLVDAEVLHILGDGDTELFAELEEVLHSLARGEDYCRMIKDVHLLIAELTWSHRLDFDECTKRSFGSVARSDIIVRGLPRLGSRLRD